VDALRNSHRMLVPGGILLDLRPGPPAAHVFAEGLDLGPIDERPFFARIRRIDRDLERLVAEGLFEYEAGLEFDATERYTTLAEVFEEMEEWEEARLSKRLEARIRRAAPPVEFRHNLTLRRYRAL
jgi:SAM-dependent methyltransferase